MQNEPLDIISLLMLVLATITSRELAQAVGPYAAIGITAWAGAMFSLTSCNKKMTNRQAAWYVAARIVLAVLLTVSLAEILHSLWPSARPRYTLPPLAFCIGWVGDFERVKRWLVVGLEKLIGERK